MGRSRHVNRRSVLPVMVTDPASREIQSKKHILMVMENDGRPGGHIPCQPWAGQNDWSTTSTQGPLFNPPRRSQDLSLGSSSCQRPPYSLQASNQSCMIDMNALSTPHHSALYKASHSGSSNNFSSAALFADAALPGSSHSISFLQQSPHTSSMLLTANQGGNIPPPSLPQTSQAPQTCGPQQLPLLSTQNPLEVSFPSSLTNHGLPNGLQDMSISMLPYGQQHVQQHVNSQVTSEGANVEFAGVSGNTCSHSLSTSQEQHQWIPSSQCREPANKSVPDAAAHPNKEPSQHAGNEKLRSVLLHQRAQLLQQLAELDKHLESVPPDDSGDGPSEPTAVQFTPLIDDSSQGEQNKSSDAEQDQPCAGESESQSCLAADYSAPQSCDVKSETCNSPEDPLSEAESVGVTSPKKENVSDESEDDGDPDYFPNGHSDSSDVPADPDGGSSDESRQSVPSDPAEAEEPSSFPRKNGAKSGMSLSKSVHLPKQTCAIKQRKSFETVVAPCSGSKGQRYNKRNYCLFCSKPISKMARHLERIHSDKKEVAAASQYPLHSRERLKIWSRLINQGNFAHNKDVLKTGKGQLVVRQRPRHTRQSRDFLHCLYCRGLFTKSLLHRHMRSCPEKERNGKEPELGRKRIASQCVLEASEDLGITDGLKGILCKMTYNDVTQTIMDDKVILQFGELLFTQHGSDVKKHDYIRQNLRQIARLVVEAQKITPLKKLEDFFLPSSFPHVVSAVNVVAGYNPDTKGYSIPSLAVKLGYHLQKACTIVEDNAVKSGDTSLAESAQRFISVYQKKWNKLISGSALTSIKEIKVKKAKKVPSAQDIKCLSFHMESAHVAAEKKLRDSTSTENYVALVKVILARTVVFNRRKSIEVSSLELKDFTSRKNSNLHTDMDVSVSDLERTMCRFFTRVDIRGQCGRMVPVILKPSFVSSMELIVKVREECGVPGENPFIFGRPHALSAYDASGCIQKYVKECGAKDPDAMTLGMIRKHYTKMLQLLNLDENEADQILGPNNQVRILRESGSVQIDDDERHFDERLQAGGRRQAASWTDNDKSGKSAKKGTRNKGKHKWEEAEVRAVERHMMRFIQGHKVPQKNDCIQCLDAESEALRTRSWKGVKDYVRNRITTLKNAKKCGAKDSEGPTSKKSRKSYTTPHQDQHETGQILGPNNRQQKSSMQVDEVQAQSDYSLKSTRGQQAASWGHHEQPGAHRGPAEFDHEQAHGATAAAKVTAPRKSAKPCKNTSRGTQNNSKHKWEEAEVRAVERHMMRFIQGHKVPQKNDCIQCLEAEPEALRTRSWKGVKDYVRNRITTLRRKPRNSQTASTKRN